MTSTWPTYIECSILYIPSSSVFFFTTLLTKILLVGERLGPPMDKAMYEDLCHENQSEL